MVDEQEISLQPIEEEVQRRQLQQTQQQLQRAKGRLAYEEILADEDRARELTVRDLGCQFCIRHMLIATSLAAVSVAVFLKAGPYMGVPIALLATFLGIYYFVHDWHLQFEAEIRRRKREWNVKYQVKN
ncbi:MAG: hypothetical protein ACE361_02510 [Aureliella sp.]